MIRNTAYRYRLYPNKEQAAFLEKQFGCVRYAYNTLVSKNKEDYLIKNIKYSFKNNLAFITHLKYQDGYLFLKEGIAQSLQVAVSNFDTAMNNLFFGIARPPRYHKKREYQSIKISQSFEINKEENLLFIPKLETGIKINIHRPLPKMEASYTRKSKFRKKDALIKEVKSNIISITISKMASGKYYVSVACEEDIEELTPNNNIIGLDLGIKSFLVNSKGDEIPNPRYLERAESRLRHEQKRFSKMKKGSKRREKQRIKLARLHDKVANQRKDFLHKLSRAIVNENQVIIAETLRVANMIRNHKLAKAIASCGWGLFLEMLKYKSEWAGRIFYQIGTFFASSKLCSACGYKNDNLTLSIREWTCPECGVVHDRDENAAINILNKGIEDLTKAGRLLFKEPSGIGMLSDANQKLDMLRNGSSEAEALTSASPFFKEEQVGSLTRETAAFKQR
jgi:putative transposase